MTPLFFNMSLKLFDSNKKYPIFAILHNDEERVLKDEIRLILDDIVMAAHSEQLGLQMRLLLGRQPMLVLRPLVTILGVTVMLLPVSDLDLLKREHPLVVLPLGLVANCKAPSSELLSLLVGPVLDLVVFPCHFIDVACG